MGKIHRSNNGFRRCPAVDKLSLGGQVCKSHMPLAASLQCCGALKTTAMRQLLTVTILLFGLSTFGQPINSAEWEAEAKTNIRLLPKYGRAAKTDNQKKFDRKFIDQMMQLEQFGGDRTAASNHMIAIGFSYLYSGDPKTAMFRFNQAYLLDSLNSEIYWGYGAVYMALGDFEKAKKQYEEGLSQSPDNTHLLTSYGSWYLARPYDLESIDEAAEAVYKNIDSALTYLLKSYYLDPRYQDTAYKISLCYWLKDDCDNAWRFYDICNSLGGQAIPKAYKSDLKKKCKRKK